MSSPQRITIIPHMPYAGGTALVCYDFDGSGLDSTRIEASFDPPDGSKTYPLTPEKRCADVDIPEGADGLTLHDVDGISPDLSVTILS